MCASVPPGHDWEVALDALATVEPVVGARVDRALRSPSAALTPGARDRRRHGSARPGGRAAARAAPRRPLRVARHPGLGDLRGPGTRPAAARRACARRRRECWWPSSRPRLRSPRLSPAAARERQVASVVSGFGRRLLAASVPVAAVAYAWASIETAPSARVFVGVAALAVPSALPSQLAVRVGVAVATLVGPDARRGRERAWGEVRDVADQGLRDIYAVAPPFVPTTPPRAACARPPRRLRVLPRDRGHRREPAVPRRSGCRRRGRLARDDPAGPEHRSRWARWRSSRPSGRS